MAVPVHLNSQTKGRVIKINNVGANAVLPTKSRTNVFLSEMQPKQTFCFGRLPANEPTE